MRARLVGTAQLSYFDVRFRGQRIVIALSSLPRVYLRLRQGMQFIHIGQRRRFGQRFFEDLGRPGFSKLGGRLQVRLAAAEQPLEESWSRFFIGPLQHAQGATLQAAQLTQQRRQLSGLANPTIEFL